MDLKVLFNFYTFIIFFEFSNASQNASKEMGPYKVTVLRSERCKNPTKPYDQNPMAYLTSEIYTFGKRRLLRGNLTVVKVDPHIWLQSKSFILEDGKYQTIYVANAVGCNGVLMRIFKLGLNVPHLKGCVPKGIYSYKDLDFNAVQQSWSKTIKYGSYLWRLQAGTRTSTSICWEFQTVTTPI